MLKGIYNSCNSFFAKTYRRIIEKDSTAAAGLDRWRTHLEKFGLGNYLGYDLPIGKKEALSQVAPITIGGIRKGVGVQLR